MKAYVRTAKSHPWLLPPIEDALKNADLNTINDVAKLARGVRAPGGRPISDDEVFLALSALCDLGVLERSGVRYRLDLVKLEATEQLRDGVRATVEILAENPTSGSSEVQFCVSLPPALSSAASHVILESSIDLRSSLLDVIASAKETLIMASPFWDAKATAELVTLIRKKLDAGVQISLLGRFARDLKDDVKSQLTQFSSHPGCAILSWIEGTGSELQTFHFKAISSDRGERAYLGSANMTFWSLRSSMELGVILTGSVASQLDRILRVVISMAEPITL